MNIVVIGAGAVGGYFGGKLAESGVPVEFLVREKRKQQLEARGLRVQSVHGDFTIQPQCVLSADQIENPDLVIIAVKNYQLDGAMKDLETLVQRGAKILPLMNGVQHFDRLVSDFGSDKILGGLCYVESTLNEIGDIVQKSMMQDIVFGSLSPATDVFFLQEVESIFKTSGVNVKMTSEILTEIWTKYIFLVTLSGITTVTRNPIGLALSDPVTFAFLMDMVEELTNLARTLEIKLPENFSNQMVNKIKKSNPEMTSSMHRDLQKGLPLELESLQGAILKIADDQKVPTPCTRAVFALLHPFVKGSMTENIGRKI